MKHHSLTDRLLFILIAAIALSINFVFGVIVIIVMLALLN